MIREARGFTQAHLAVEALTSQQTVDRLERGEVRESSALERIAAALGYRSARDLMEDPSFEPGNAGRAAEERERTENPRFRLLLPVTTGRIPVFMDDHLDEAVMEIACPEPLINVRGGYGVIISRSDMAPAYEPGDAILLHPFLPPRPGSDVFYRNSSGAYLLRRLLSSDDTLHTVKAWGNPAEQTITLADWPTRHVVVGKYMRG